MKRSGQIALVLMGVTGATAAGAYMAPSRQDCRPQPAPVRDITDLGKTVPPSEPCRRRNSRGSWHWGSNYSTYSTSRTTSGRPSNSTSVGFTSSNSSGRSSGTGSSSSSASRGGFGSTGHGMSGHSGGS